jgi:hypothetical protein
LVPSAAFAQAGIAGIVRDTSGAVLPGVTVEASSPALIEKVRAVVTDTTGQYQVVDLRPGTYTVTFTLPGFSTFKREGIELSGTFVATVNADLRVGALEETITVTGETPVVDIRNVKTQAVLDKEVIAAIPTGRNYQNLHVLVPGVTIASGNQDVGGSGGDVQVNYSAHGGDVRDSRTQVNGMVVQDVINGGGRSMYVPHAGTSEEVSITTSGGLGEADTAGVVVNVIPRDGGNTFSGMVFGTGATERMVSSNYDQELRDRGLRAPNKVVNVFDVEGTYGGPVRKDKLWFFADARYNGNSNRIAGMFVNRNAGDPTKWAYDPDFDQQVVADNNWKAASLRLTWQATQKHKIAASFEDQLRCVGCKSNGTATSTPEASGRGASHPNNLAQLTWTAPVTNRLLFDAGAAVKVLRWGSTPFPGQTNPELIRVTEQGGLIPNLTYRAAGLSMHKGWLGTYPSRAAISYVSGAHSTKFGYNGVFYVSDTTAGSFTGLAYRFRDGIPNQLTESAHPLLYTSYANNWGLYAQDQWTVKRLTLAGGVRYDRYVTWYPDSQVGPVRFVPVPVRFPAEDGFSTHDVTVRSSAAYDLFGNGKTAIKVSLGKYLNAQDSNAAPLGPAPRSPIARLAISTSRAWNDANRNYVPDCELLNLAANGECGAASDQNFGKPALSTTFDPALHGWGVRPYNWNFDIGVQRELLPSVSVNATYFRRWFGNFIVSANRAITAADVTYFDVPLPNDPRLPASGTVRGYSDTNPSKFGQVDNYITAAKTFGRQTQHWNGMDVTVNARLPRGVVQGGVSGGRESRDNCDIVDKVPALNNAGADPPNTPMRGLLPLQFCRVDGKFLAQLKLLGAYELPRVGVQIAATLQNIPGQESIAAYVAPNAVVAPLLGRNLSGAAANTTLALLPPLKYFQPRLNQLDFRASKIVRVGGDRLLLSVDLFNALNSNAAQTYNGSYNPTGQWLTPLTILAPRFAKVSAQLDF